MSKFNKLGYKYFRIVVTAASGEKNSYYYSGKIKPDSDPIDNIYFAKFIDECIYDNAVEWYNKETEKNSFKEYLEKSTAKYEEISYKEYISNLAEC